MLKKRLLGLIIGLLLLLMPAVASGQTPTFPATFPDGTGRLFRLTSPSGNNPLTWVRYSSPGDTRPNSISTLNPGAIKGMGANTPGNGDGRLVFACTNDALWRVNIPAAGNGIITRVGTGTLPGCDGLTFHSSSTLETPKVYILYKHGPINFINTAQSSQQFKLAEVDQVTGLATDRRTLTVAVPNSSAIEILGLVSAGNRMNALVKGVGQRTTRRSGPVNHIRTVSQIDTLRIYRLSPASNNVSFVTSNLRSQYQTTDGFGFNNYNHFDVMGFETDGTNYYATQENRTRSTLGFVNSVNNYRHLVAVDRATGNASVGSLSNSIPRIGQLLYSVPPVPEITGVTFNPATSTSLGIGYTVHTNNAAATATIYAARRTVGSTSSRTAVTLANQSRGTNGDFAVVVPVPAGDVGWNEVCFGLTANPTTHCTEGYTDTLLVTDLRLGAVTSSSAVTVTIYINPQMDAAQVLNLRYRTGTEDWTTETATVDPISRGQEHITLQNLTANSDYEAQASFDSSYPAKERRELAFSTSSPPPGTPRGATLGGLTIQDRATESATAHITLTATSNVTVYERHKVQGATAFSSTAQTAASCVLGLCRAQFNLLGLTANTTYEVEVSLTANFAEVVRQSFTTLQEAEETTEFRIAAIHPGNVGWRSAQIEVELANADGTVRTIWLRWGLMGEDGSVTIWLNDSRGTGRANLFFELANLLAERQYRVEASTDPAFPLAGDTASATFSTIQQPERTTFIGSVRLVPEPNFDRLALGVAHTYTLEGVEQKFPVVLRAINQSGETALQLSTDGSTDCNGVTEIGGSVNLVLGSTVTVFSCATRSGNAGVRILEKGGDQDILNEYVFITHAVLSPPVPVNTDLSLSARSATLREERLGLAVLIKEIAGRASVNANPSAIVTAIALLWPVVLSLLALYGLHKTGMAVVGPLPVGLVIMVLAIGWSASTIFMGLSIIYLGGLAFVAAIGAVILVISRIIRMYR